MEMKILFHLVLEKQCGPWSNEPLIVLDYRLKLDILCGYTSILQSLRLIKLNDSAELHFHEIADFILIEFVTNYLRK